MPDTARLQAVVTRQKGCHLILPIDPMLPWLPMSEILTAVATKVRGALEILFAAATEIQTVESLEVAMPIRVGLLAVAVKTGHN